jgi:hypothetical protein
MGRCFFVLCFKWGDSLSGGGWFVDPQRHTEILSHLGPKYLPRSSVGGRGAGRTSATPYDLVSFTKDSGKKKNKSVILPAKLIYLRCGNKVLPAIVCQ